MYRGTAGTEVAYLLRRLFRRLDLDRHPHQLSILSTSASLDPGVEGERFLAEFFGRQEAFTFVTTPPFRPEATGDLSSLKNEIETGQLSAVESLPAEDLQAAFFDATSDDGRPRATALSEVAQRLFPGGAEPEVLLDQLVELLAQSPSPQSGFEYTSSSGPLQGLWACADPSCAEVPAEHRSEDRRVGRVYSRPLFTCPCGSRVLELLYCQSCGELMLGGYVTRSGQREFLVSTSANLDRLPEHGFEQRNAKDYRVYWPSNGRNPVVDKWERAGGDAAGGGAPAKYTFSFRRVSLLRAVGQLDYQPKGQTTGHVFQVKANPKDAEGNLPAYPQGARRAGTTGSAEVPAMSRTRSAPDRRSIRRVSVSTARTRS